MTKKEAITKDRAALAEALKEAANVINLARRYFPKSMHNADKFTLEQTCAAVNKALTMVGE